MIDHNANWRNHRWSFDADYCDREDAPILEGLILEGLILEYGFMFDDTYIYIRQGKKKQFIIRFPHYGVLNRTNYRVPMEHHKPRDPNQTKLLEVPVNG